MSFFEELQTGCSVILPSEDYQNSLERSKDRCRTIKDRSSSKIRQTLAEEIEDAKKIIVDSERKGEITPAVVGKVSDQSVISRLQGLIQRRTPSKIVFFFLFWNFAFIWNYTVCLSVVKLAPAIYATNAFSSN